MIHSLRDKNEEKHSSNSITISYFSLSLSLFIGYGWRGTYRRQNQFHNVHSSSDILFIFQTAFCFL